MNDIPNIVRADFIAKHRARVERATLAECHAAERAAREALTLCSAHPVPAVYRHDVSAILGELCYEVGTYDGHLAIYFQPLSDVAMMEEAMALGAAILRAEPRMFAAIMRSIRWNAKQCVVYFDLPVRDHPEVA